MPLKALQARLRLTRSRKMNACCQVISELRSLPEVGSKTRRAVNTIPNKFEKIQTRSGLTHVARVHLHHHQVVDYQMAKDTSSLVIQFFI
jgi:hypothetical protein